MKSFMAGLGIGIGIGILFAPLTGEETRSRLSDRAGELADSARDLVDEGREQVRRNVSRMRKKAEGFGGQEAAGAESFKDL
jgi:hypothetical protein